MPKQTDKISLRSRYQLLDYPVTWEIAVHLAVACDVFDCVFLCCPFSQRDVLDEIWDLIEPISEGFPFYSDKISIICMNC